MALRQVLLCPVCGKSNDLRHYAITTEGNAAPERLEYELRISLCHQQPGTGKMFWTHHEIPLHVLLALRQKIAEALNRIDARIVELVGDNEDA